MSDALKITRKSGSNLALSFMSLPPEKRHAMSVFYAYCRLADDIVDDPAASIEEKRSNLRSWREEIRACYSGTPSTEHGLELQDIIRSYLIPPQPMLDILDGVEMDLTRSRYETFDELYQYCYRVASAVGLVSIEIFGYNRPASRDYAVALGMAFQLTNILRDVRYDLEHYGRIYLPLEELRAFHVQEKDLLDPRPSHGKSSLMRMQFFRAMHYFNRAARLLPAQDRPNFMAAEIMTEVYHRMLLKNRRKGFPCQRRPVRLSKLEKLLAIQYARKHGAKINRKGLSQPVSINILGAGFSGIGAALEAGLQGHIPHVHESKSYVGGRAHSFQDAKSGLTLDNGQHVMFGCYHKTMDMLDMLGVTYKLDRQNGIHVPYVRADGSATALKAGPWPAPLHLLHALFGFSAIDQSDRRAILRLGWQLKFGDAPPPQQTALGWLKRQQQTPGAMKALWEPFCISALNEPLETASALLLHSTLVQCLFGSRKDSSIYISRYGLSDLLMPEAMLFLESIGGSLQTGSTIKHLELSDGFCHHITNSKGKVSKANIHISCLPWNALTALLPEDSTLRSQTQKISGAPIIAVHLVCDQPLMRHPFVGFLDSPVQWVFDRSHHAIEPGQYIYSVIISAAGELMDTPIQKLVDKIWFEIQRHLPAAKRAQLLHHVVYKSRDATFTATPETDALRPAMATEWKNLILAGDWVQNQLPSTIEGAVLNGVHAVRSLDTVP